MMFLFWSFDMIFEKFGMKLSKVGRNTSAEKGQSKKPGRDTSAERTKKGRDTNVDDHKKKTTSMGKHNSGGKETKLSKTSKNDSTAKGTFLI